MAAEAIRIIDRPLAPVDTAAMRQQYGVAFVPATAENIKSFDGLRDRLLHERLRYDHFVAEAKPAIVHRPQFFLAESLTAEQVAAINDNETHAIANYCIEVQTRLAKVPIIESLEPLVHMPTVFSGAGVPAGFSEAPFHPACGGWANKPREFWARREFADRLLLMGRVLGEIGLQLYVEDAFRPVGVQEGLFKRRFDWTKADHPDWSDDQLLAETRSKTAITPRLASHKAGAAVDARLQDRLTGDILDFGHNYPDGGALVFPATPFVTAEQWRNRQLFQVAAGLSGLTLYVGEDWHVSYGDNLASLDENGVVRPDYTAKYGPVKDFDRTTGSIIDVYNLDTIDTVFEH